MREDRVIEESVSPWWAPVVLVKKKDGSLRFRRLNEQADLDAYPMPRIEDLIDRLGGAQYLTTIDFSERVLASAHGSQGLGVDGICNIIWTAPF